jgi:hypothetical protein
VSICGTPDEAEVQHLRFTNTGCVGWSRGISHFTIFRWGRVSTFAPWPMERTGIWMTHDDDVAVVVVEWLVGDNNVMG